MNNQKYFRVYSDSFDGQVFTEKAFLAMKGQLCNGKSEFYETKVITVADIGDNEKVNDVEDLTGLGFQVDGNVAEDDEGDLTEQNDDEFLDSIDDEDDYEEYF